MAQFPSTLVEHLEPLPTDLGEIGNAAAARVAERGFQVKAGLTPHMACLISVEAQNPDVQEFCPKDSTNKRFASLDSTSTWLAKHGGRGVLLLTQEVENSDETLAGWGWTGFDSENPEGNVAFAVRLGEQARGKRLATDYSRLIVAASLTLFNVNPASITLETWRSNTGAVKIYERIGFIETQSTLETRPTLQPVNTSSENGALVWRDESGGHLRRDERVCMQFVGEPA